MKSCRPRALTRLFPEITTDRFRVECRAKLRNLLPMQIISTVAAMQRLAKKWRRAGTKVGLVPTMGYLHDGHMSLVRAARQHVGSAGRVVLSIYVNPTQFGPKEDLSKYPRDLKRDLSMCRAGGVDAVFVPGDGEMYSHLAAAPTRPDAFSTYVVE